MMHNFFTNTSLLIPSLALPAVLLHGVRRRPRGDPERPGFDFPAGYTAFQFVFVLLQSAAFAGVFTGFGIARDFESGFARRLLLASSNRSGIVLGYAIAALGRWLVTAALLTAIALAVRMKVGGGAVDLVGLYTLGLIVTRRRRCGRRASRCGSARCRPGRSCRCRSSSSSSSRRSTCRSRCSRVDPHGRDAEPADPRDRVRPRLHLGRADRGRARVDLGAAVLGRAVRALGDPRPAQGRSRGLGAQGRPAPSLRCPGEPRGQTRIAVPARSHVGRRRNKLLAVLGERRAGRGLPLRSARRRGADRGASSSPRTTGTATSRGSGRDSATGTASTGPGRPRTGTASTRQSS